MNQYEKRMLAILTEGRASHGFVSVKAEFEAEGTRSDEFLRLLELARRAGLKVALKIGGCEAIRDLIEARQYGVDFIIAPMIETPYALSKFIAAKDKVFPKDEQADMSFLFNVETATTFESLETLGEVAQAGNVGMVFGRVDFEDGCLHLYFPIVGLFIGLFDDVDRCLDLSQCHFIQNRSLVSTFTASICWSL